MRCTVSHGYTSGVCLAFRSASMPGNLEDIHQEELGEGRELLCIFCAERLLIVRGIIARKYAEHMAKINPETKKPFLMPGTSAIASPISRQLVVTHGSGTSSASRTPPSGWKFPRRTMSGTSTFGSRT